MTWYKNNVCCAATSQVLFVTDPFNLFISFYEEDMSPFLLRSLNILWRNVGFDECLSLAPGLGTHYRFMGKAGRSLGTH
jgi:hypothetical protein